MSKRLSSLKQRLIPNVDLVPLFFGLLTAAIGLIPMICALNIVQQDESSFPSGRPVVYVAGLAFVFGGLCVAIRGGLGNTELLRSFKGLLGDVTAAFAISCLAAIPWYLLAAGARGTATVSFIGTWTIPSGWVDKPVLLLSATLTGAIAAMAWAGVLRRLAALRK
jgi:hypothetical protein